MGEDDILKLAEVLWNYHVMSQPVPDQADFVLALGSHDDRVASRAADLVLSGIAPLLVISGGHGKVTRETQAETEGSRFRRIAIERGVAPDVILVENEATNTGENITRTRQLLKSQDLAPSTGILVAKPYMERRSWATAVRQWPEVEWHVTAPKVTFEDYPTEDVPFRRMVELMVGDLQRIKIYGEQGFQVPQEIPDQVWDAYDTLVNAGFDRFVMKADA